MASCSKVRRLALRWSWRGLKALGLLLLTYVLIIFVGLIPVNNDFEPTDDGVEIFIISSEVHADLIMPIANDLCDWREDFPLDDFTVDTLAATHVAIGWGDKGFFIHTPTWSDLKVSTALHALFWPSESCMHVTMLRREWLGEDVRSVRISNEQYAQLAAFIRASFRRDDESSARIPDASYDGNDAFYNAEGSYWCLNTCNSWAGRALQSAGVRVAWLTPLPKEVYLYLPEDRR